MTDETTGDQLRQELKDIDADLADLRRVTGDVQSRRGEDGDQSEGFEEPEDIAANLTGLAETEAVIDTLESRREAVEARLRAME
jgi:peptidoglycan hydrolase CwlO-like protein